MVLLSIRRICLFLFGVAVCLQCWGQTRRWVDKSTDIIMFVPAVTALSMALYEKDYQGMKQLALSGITSTATNYLLEVIVKKKRPDSSGNHAFPSTHTTAAFTGAAFLERRYGWKWGIPAYAISAYVAWGRVYAQKHDIWDVLAGTIIGVGASYIYTRPFVKKAQLVLAPAVVYECPGLYFCASF